MTDAELAGTFDAWVWAREFVAAVEQNPAIATDEGTMLSWFASAIMAGYDEAKRRAVPAQAADAVDPHAADTGKPSTRDA